MAHRVDHFEAFAQKVRVTETCWLWEGGIVNRQGHGRAGVINNRRMLAHRYAFEIFNGPIPEKLVIDHLCKNPSCVNPHHLQAVTHQENLLRGKHIKPCLHGQRATSHCPECTAKSKTLAAQRFWKKKLTQCVEVI